MKVLKFQSVFLALAVIFSTACGEQVTAEPTAALTDTTVPPTATPTLTPTLIMPSPTATSFPVMVVGGDGEIDLPDWVADPVNNILLLPELEGDHGRPTKFKLVNPDSGERVIVELSKEYYFHYWKDPDHIVFLQVGYCDETPRYISELDISTGTLWEGEAKDYLGEIQDCYYFWGLEDDGISINRNLPEPTIEIVDAGNGRQVALTSQTDGYSDLYYKSSPNRDFLAVVQVTRNFVFPELRQPIYGNQISIYHVQDRRLLARFSEEGEIATQILFLDNENLIYVRGDTPCFISILSNSRECINTVAQKFPGATVILGEPLSNPHKFSFLYFHSTLSQSGFCFYDLFSEDLDCPSSGFSRLDRETIINYSLSPDEKHLLLQYDRKGCPLPWCDYFAGSHWELINIDENMLYDLGPAEIDQFRPVQPSPWRPKP